ncbi:MAG: CrcB family protein [Fimbriimonadaceae bacterium]|nr:CrcB family protein [Fimbriimonadaceae bacterium]
MRPLDCLLVFAGAGFGGVSRYGISYWMSHMQQPNLVSLLVVNLIGSFILGFVVAVWGASDQRAFLFWGPGFTGGFTTFSAFSYELVELWRTGKHGMFAFLILASVVLGIAAAALGFFIGQRIRPEAA